MSSVTDKFGAGTSTPRERMLDRQFDNLIARIKINARPMTEDEFLEHLHRIAQRCHEMRQHEWMRK